MTTMTLGQLRDELRKYDPMDRVRLDCLPRVQPTTFDSWRGVYAELALGYETIHYRTTPITVGELLTRIEAAPLDIYEGWKGGSNRVTYDTPVHLDNRGCYTCVEITGTRMDDQEVLITLKGEEE